LISVLAAPAWADWLVTNDGHLVETRGEWRVEGDLILFELPGGGLVSMPADEVDLAASEAATAEAEEARIADSAQEPVDPGPSRYRITDADVGHVDDDEPVGGEPADEAPAADVALVVSDWEDETDPDDEGIRLTGTLTNESDDAHGNLRLLVRLYDDGLIASSSARLASRALPPGEATRFEVIFPGVFDYGEVQFETEGIGFVTAPPPEPAEDDDGFLDELEENET
jgi:hypothetical protein